MSLSSRLSRVTSAGRIFLPQIDGLRFIAIMGVIACHVLGSFMLHRKISEADMGVAGQLVTNAFGAGLWGVQLFFTISGFILVFPFAKQHLTGSPPVSLRAYFVRRITRLEPPYIIHLCFLFLLSFLILRRFPSHPDLYHNDAWASHIASHLMASLCYSHGFVFQDHPYPNIVLWSLETEVQFYILAPFIALLFKISSALGRRTLLAGMMLAVPTALYFQLIPATYVIRWSLAGNLQCFLAGFLFCDLYLTSPIATAPRSYAWDFLCVLAAGTAVGLSRNAALLILFPWLALIGCIAAFRGIICSRLLGYAWISTIGGMCYTIYMYHYLMISGILRASRRLQTNIMTLDLVIQFVIASMIIVGGCALLFVLFERPFMQRNWHTKIWDAIRGLVTRLTLAVAHKTSNPS